MAAHQTFEHSHAWTLSKTDKKCLFILLFKISVPTRRKGHNRQNGTAGNVGKYVGTVTLLVP